MSNILIVGANQGIGYYMAIRLLEKGNKVTVLDIQDNHINDVCIIADQMVQQVASSGADVSAFIKSMDKMDFFIKYPDVIRQIREVYEYD